MRHTDRWRPDRNPASVTLTGLGLVAGLVLYAVDVLVIFPTAFPWFLENSRVTQSLEHALFGAVTGYWLSWRTIALRNRPAVRDDA